MDKLNCYKYLAEIRDTYHKDINEQIVQVAGKNYIPATVVKFIHQFIPQPEVEVFNQIYKNRKKHPLYKNLVNERAEIADKAIALSSLVTRYLIKAESLPFESRHALLTSKEYNLALEAIQAYSSGDVQKLETAFNTIRTTAKAYCGGAELE